MAAPEAGRTGCRAGASAGGCSHCAGHQLIAVIKLAVQDLHYFGDRVIGNAGADPYWFQSLVRT